MTENSPSLLSLLDQIRGIALEGLKYAENPYDIDRYNKLLAMAAENYADILRTDHDKILTKLREQMGSTTPKCGSDAAVFNDKGEVLVLKRSDSGTWCLPCGWIDVHETPFEAAEREVMEEAGLKLAARGLINIHCNGPDLGTSIHHEIDFLVLMEVCPADAVVTLSHEHTDFRWIRSIPGEFTWHPAQKGKVERVLDFIASTDQKTLAIEGSCR